MSESEIRTYFSDRFKYQGEQVNRGRNGFH